MKTTQVREFGKNMDEKEVYFPSNVVKGDKK